MKKLQQLLTILLLGVGIGLAQNSPTPFNQLLTLTDSTSTTDSTRLVTDLVPMALLSLDDSVKVPTVVTFEVSFGNASNRRWYKLKMYNDTTSYSVTVSTDTCLIPLDPKVFATVKGQSFTGMTNETAKFDVVWLRLRVSVKLDGDQHFILRQREL